MIGYTIFSEDQIEYLPNKICQLYTHNSKPYQKIINNSFIEKLQNANIGIYVHSTFNLVLGHPSAKKFLYDHIQICDEIGAIGLVVHIPNKNSDDFLPNIKNINPTSKNTIIFLEHKPGIYADPKKLIEIYYQIANIWPNIKIGICIDTCHIYVSGYDLSNPKIMQDYINEIAILECPILVHLNDSKVECGAMIDRHAQIGTNIWTKEKYQSLDILLSKNWPFIIELKNLEDSIKSFNFIKLKQ